MGAKGLNPFMILSHLLSEFDKNQALQAFVTQKPDRVLASTVWRRLSHKVNSKMNITTARNEDIIDVVCIFWANLAVWTDDIAF